MENKNKLLEIRIKLKKKMPKLIRHDTHKFVKLEKKWVRPKGRHAKMRLNKKGKRTTVRSGYGSPTAVKGLHKSGLKAVLVQNVESLDKINPKSEGIVISQTTGMRKKAEIVKKAVEKNITILNLKNPGEFLKSVDEKLSKRKEKKKKVISEKEQKKKELEKKAEEKTKEDEKNKKEEKDEELAKKIEKEEKEKVLTQKI